MRYDFIRAQAVSGVGLAVRFVNYYTSFMPPKTKKKRSVAKFSVEASAPALSVDSAEENDQPAESTSVRQVVEVVEEDATAQEALETIKEDAREIEEAVESIEEEVAKDEEKLEADADHSDSPEPQERSKDVVESLFSRQQSSVGPEITVVGKRDKTLGVWVGAMLGIALAVGVSLVVLVRGPQTLTGLIKKPEPTPTATVAPTATPQAAVERKDIKIKVLNGGGVAGAGGTMKSFLEEKGYTVTEVGNASEYTYETTDIVVKSGKEAYAKMLADDLKADYSLGSSSATLDESAAYDAEVIVGKE